MRPRLEYCSLGWCSDPYFWKVGKVAVAGGLSTFFESQSSRFRIAKHSQSATLAWRRRFHRLTLMWQLYNGLGPPQLLSVFSEPLSVRSSLIHRVPHSLRFPSSSTSRSLSSFLCLSVPEWNALPTDVVLISSLPMFVARLRRVLDFDRFLFGL